VYSHRRPNGPRIIRERRVLEKHATLTAFQTGVEAGAAQALRAIAAESMRLRNERKTQKAGESRLLMTCDRGNVGRETRRE